MIDIVDAIGYITSDDYKDRFIGEYIELAIRLERLQALIFRLDHGLVENPAAYPADLLAAQDRAMQEYKQVLEQRAIYEEIDLDI